MVDKVNVIFCCEKQIRILVLENIMPSLPAIN